MEKSEPLPKIHAWYPHIKKQDAFLVEIVEDVKIAHMCIN